MRLRLYFVFLLTYRTMCLNVSHDDGAEIDCRTNQVTEYNGTMNTTISGRTCQAWSLQTPHKHSFNATQYGYGQHNYCRNPGESQKRPWCFTTDKDPVWEYCEVCLCNTVAQRECKETVKGQEYRGTVNTSSSGKKCEPWKFAAIHHSQAGPLNECWEDAKNYCRNPDNASGGPWCYVANGRSIYKDYCKVELCDTISDEFNTESTDASTIIPSTESTGAPTTESTTESVNISNSGLTEVPEDLPENAIRVDLSNNQIVRLRQGVFVRIRNCKVLNLAGNSISHIEAGAFEDLGQLRELALSGNPLKEINQSMWNGLHSLRILRIRAVHLTTISPDDFQNLDHLRLIHINMGVLEKIQSHFLNGNISPGTRRNLQIVVELRNSSLSCDRSLCWLKQAEKQKLIAHYTVNGHICRPKCQKNPERYWSNSTLSCDPKGNSGKREDYTGVYIMLAVVVGVIIIAVWLFLMLRWAGCIYKKPKSSTGPGYYHYEPRGLDELPVSHSSNVYS